MEALIEALAAQKVLDLAQKVHDSFGTRYSWLYSKEELGFAVPDSMADAVRVVKGVLKGKGFSHQKNKSFPEASSRSPLARRTFDHIFQNGDEYFAVMKAGKHKGKIPTVRVVAFTTNRSRKNPGPDFRQVKQQDRGSRSGTGRWGDA